MEREKDIFPFNLNDRIVLSPYVRMRRDRTKIAFAYLPHLSLQYTVITPADAVVLCLFNGKRTLEDILTLVSLFGKINFESARQVVSNVMHRVSRDLIAFVKQDSTISARTFLTSAYMIPDNQVDLRTRLDAPLTMILQPTSECQTDCVYCYACRRNVPHNELLPLSRIQELLDEAAHIGIYQVNLCGGDGFCRDDFPTIIRECIARDMIVDISTKASISRQMANVLADMRLDYIQVSIDTSCEETADYLYGVKGHFKKVTESIRNLMSVGIYTRTNSIVTPYNYEEISYTISYLKDFGIRDMKFSPAFRSYYRKNANCMLPVEKKNEFKKRMAEIEAENKKQGLSIYYDAMDDFTEMDSDAKKEYWFSKRPRCSSGRCNLVITPDGKVVPCEEAPQTEEYFLGDVKKQSILEVWNSPAMIQFTYPERDKFLSTPCYECADFIQCVHETGHCFRDCLKVYGNKYEANPFCPYSHESTNRIY